MSKLSRIGGVMTRRPYAGGRKLALGAVAALLVAATAALPARAPREFRVCARHREADRMFGACL